MTDVLAEVVAEGFNILLIMRTLTDCLTVILPVFVIVLKVVKAGAAARVPQPSVGKHLFGIIENKFLRVDVFQEPGERFTLELFFELESSLQTS